MKRVILVGGGYSVKEGIEKGLWDRIKNEHIWSCNYAFMAMPYLPKKEIWVDIAFYKNNIEVLQNLWEKGVELHTKKHPTYAGIVEHLFCYDSTREVKNYHGKQALEKNMIYYGKMGLSGMFALSLAIAHGYDEIYLLGYDFGSRSVKDLNTHFYQDTLKVYSTGVMHPEVYRMPNNTVKQSEVEDFKVYLNEKDIKIFNVSPDSNIPYFEKVDYNTFFERLKDEKQG